jgi:hypothetical protein
MNKFLGPIIPFLNETKKTAELDLTGYNKAFSYNVKNAITGTYPDLKIDFSMVLLSRGDLPNVKSPEAESLSPGEILCRWTDNSGTGLAAPDDKVFLAVHFPENGSWMNKLDITKRSAGSLVFDVTDFRGITVQIYLGLISADETEVSDSFYVGGLQVI